MAVTTQETTSYTSGTRRASPDFADKRVREAIARAVDLEDLSFDHELVRAFEILRTVYSKEELSKSIDFLKGTVKQLDGRTVGLLAYNNWNTHPETCWCDNAPYKCPCEHKYNVEPEKWMSLANDLHRLDVVVCVEVSDITAVGLALNGELIYKDWGGTHCDSLPSAAIRLLEKLEALNKVE